MKAIVGILLALLVSSYCCWAVTAVHAHRQAAEVQRLRHLIDQHSRARLAETNGEWSKADVALYMAANPEQANVMPPVRTKE